MKKESGWCYFDIFCLRSSANAKKWETELQNLRNNNARLTTALQESTSNVEEWKKQLIMYKEENSHLRTRVGRYFMGITAFIKCSSILRSNLSIFSCSLFWHQCQMIFKINLPPIQVQELEFLQKESGQSVGNITQLETEKLTLEHKVGVLEKSLEQQSQVCAWLLSYVHFFLK